MDLIWASLLILVVSLSWGATLVGLPGNWGIVCVTALYAYLGPQEGSLAIGVVVLAILLATALLGEAAEVLAAALGVTRRGGTKLGAVMALVGSLVGGVVGLFVGLFVGSPIPVIGSVVASLALAAFGALVGAVIGEQWAGRDLAHSLKIGEAAFWGRLFGTFAKLLFGAVMVTVVCVALLSGA